MRICIIANAGAVHTQRWARAYAERDHTVHVLSIRRADIPGVTVHTVAVGPENSSSRIWSFLSYLRLLLSIRSALDAIGPDVVHAQYVTTNGYFAARSGRPYLLTAWGSDVIPANGKQLGVAARALARRALTGAAVVTSASRYMAEWIEQLAPGVRPEIVPFGVDTGVFRPGHDSDGGDHFTIGVVKSLERRYGIDDVLRAMPAVLDDDADARLVIAGDGRLRDRLESLGRELGVGDSVRFLGAVPHDAVPALMQTIDVLVNPTIVPESFGVVILEAEASGVPVVATDVGGIREVCVPGVTALLVAPHAPDRLAEAIDELGAHPDRRREMGTAGRELVAERFVWEDSVATMLGLLGEVPPPPDEPEGRRSTSRRRWLGAVVVVLAVALLAWIIAGNIDPLRSLAASSPAALAAVLGLQVAVLATTSWRHLVALRASGAETIGPWSWYRVFVVGRFLNLVVPQTGNVYRALVLKRDYDVSYTSFAAALFLFLWASMILNLVAGAVLLGLSDPGIAFGPVPGWIALALAAAFLVALLPGAVRLARQPREGRFLWLRSRISATLEIVSAAADTPRFVALFALSWLSGAAAATLLYVVTFDVVGISISVGLAIAIYALVQVTTVVVVTPGNLGVQEIGLVAIAVLFGVDAASAAVAAVTIRAAGMIVLSAQALPFGALRIARSPGSTPR
jgi:glycosyltransferase involved in cell wall biosynthesis/uncharacterized membrane protein YbhN (UPF0104 family)